MGFSTPVCTFFRSRSPPNNWRARCAKYSTEPQPERDTLGPMKWSYAAFAAIVLISGYLLLSQPRPAASNEERLARHRNLGKAFYENPTTQNEALAEFNAALALAP